MPRKTIIFSPDSCDHPTDSVNWNVHPKTTDDGLRYIGRCDDCGAKVAEDYLPTGEIYRID